MFYATSGRLLFFQEEEANMSHKDKEPEEKHKKKHHGLFWLLGRLIKIVLFVAVVAAIAFVVCYLYNLYM